MIEGYINMISVLYPEKDTEIVREMLKDGIINRKSALKTLVKYEIDALYKAGMKKIDAITYVSDKYGISYDLALNYEYK